MCIRDRYNTDGKVNVLGVYEGVTTYEIREYLNTKKGAKTVSYTHLDVYKRQIIDSL